MHEISLVQHILCILEDEFPDRVHQIIRIHLKAGLLSNVQPILMQNAFAAVMEHEPKYSKIILEIEVLPVLIHCEDCNLTSQVKAYRFICACGKPSKNIVQGEELMISQVEFDDMILP